MVPLLAHSLIETAVHISLFFAIEHFLKIWDK